MVMLNRKPDRLIAQAARDFVARVFAAFGGPAEVQLERLGFVVELGFDLSGAVYTRVARVGPRSVEQIVDLAGVSAKIRDTRRRRGHGRLAHVRRVRNAGAG